MMNQEVKITYTTSLTPSREITKVECKVLTEWARQEVERAVNRWVYENDVKIS